MIDATGSGWNNAKSLISIIHSLHTASWSVEGVRADWRLLGSTPDSTLHDLEKSRIGPSSSSFLDDELMILVPGLVASVGEFPPSSGVKLSWLLYCSALATPLLRQQATTCLDQLPHPGHCSRPFRKHKCPRDNAGGSFPRRKLPLLDDQPQQRPSTTLRGISPWCRSASSTSQLRRPGAGTK